MRKVYIFLAQGFEEIECLTVVDLMRRVNIPISMVSISEDLTVSGAHGIPVVADALFSNLDFSDADMLVLPGGGPGTCNLNAFEPLKDLLKTFHEKGKYIGAICAAPMILGQLGFLNQRAATCYPGFEKYLYGATHVTTPVIVDGHIITSRGLGTAIDFAGELIALLTDRQTSNAVKSEVIYHNSNH